MIGGGMTACQILAGTGGRTGEAGGAGRAQTRGREALLARTLRRTRMVPEVMLRQRLRGSREGLRFRWQHPVDPHVADFHRANARGSRPAAGGRGDRFLHENGYGVIGIGAAPIMRDVEAVVASIVSDAAQSAHHSPLASGPLPRNEEV